MIPFDFHLRTRIVFGSGKIDALGELAKDLGGSRILVVSDPGIVRAGHDAHGMESIRRAGLEVELFDGVEENPTTETVARGVEFARDYKPDLLVGLGGGSSMDCAKGINFLLTNGGRMQDYQGVGKATKPMLPMIAVPTTAGTGSETQSFALISDAETHVKMACGDPKAACAIALLDPDLTLTQPREVAALTGIDAISHAVETYVTTRRNPISQLFSRQAWKLLSTNFPKIFADPGDIEARSGMLLGASCAGLAIENSMLGATHASANPITAKYGVPHGQAIAVMLPHVIRKNARVVGDLYDELFADYRSNGASGRGASSLADVIEAFVETAGLARSMREIGVSEDAFDPMAIDASEQWTGEFNPVRLGEADFRELYECAF